MIRRGIGLILAAPLLGFLAQAALGAGSFTFPLRAWGTTLVVAGVATLIAVALGIPVGTALAHSRRSLPRTLTLFPLLLPPVLAAAAWMAASLPVPGATGCGVLLGALYWPVVALLLDAALRRLPADQLDAAALQLPPGRILRLVLWPQVRPALLVAILLVFLLAASEFTVPALFVVPTISMTIYEEMSAFRIATAASASLPLLAMGIGLAFLLRRAPSYPTSKPPRPFLSGIPLAGVRGLAVLAWTATVALPTLLFLRRSGAILPTLALNAEAVGWSFFIAGTTALLLLAWASTSPARSRLEPLWLATLVLPSIVAGQGMLQIGEGTGLRPVVGPSGALLILALMARFAIVAWLPLRDPVDRAQLEAAELSGLPRFRIWRRIVLPALLPRAAAAGAIVLVLALGEIGPVVLLSPPGRMTAAQHLFNLMHYGYDGVVASLALFLFGATALITWSATHVGRFRTN
jgi:ABC-type Fe3+ transport system permease subunit